LQRLVLGLFAFVEIFWVVSWYFVGDFLGVSWYFDGDFNGVFGFALEEDEG
jgi:hypothetical protein